MKYEDKCCNIGCNNKRHVSGKTAKGRKIRRSMCGPCHSGDIAEGVIVIKKDYCQNRDGHLGFECGINDKAIQDALKEKTSVLQLDHISGNNDDNRPKNIETLCILCHIRKTKRNSDASGHQKYNIIIEVEPVEDTPDY